MKLISKKLIRFYLQYSHGGVLIAALVGMAAGGISAALIAHITSSISNMNGKTSMWQFAGLTIAALVSNTFSGLLSSRLASKTSLEMRIQLCRKILDASLRQVETVGTSRLMATLTQDIPNITTAFLRVPGLFANFAVIFGCLIYLGTLSMGMLAALVAFLLLSVASYIIPQKRANRILRHARENWDALLSYFRALSDGAKELKLNRRRREAFFSDLLLETAKTIQRRNLSGQQIYVFINSWSQVLYFIAVGLILFLLPGLLGDISASTLTGYALTVLYMAGPVAQLVGLLPTFGSASISFQKLNDLGLSIEFREANGDNYCPSEVDTHWDRLELNGITHTYQRENEANNFMLGPINLTFYPGELIFLIGGNGSGKTTFAKLLTGLYIPESGEILLDGTPVTGLNRDHYRQYFSAVFSDFYLFEQLLGFRETNLDRRAGDYLDKLQLNHKLEIKEGKLSTTDLSQGQRKRLALLTAYLEDRPIYVFDEWAADQDPIFKEIFYFQLLPELKARGKTVVVISHDNRYFHIADRVIKLDYGKIEDEHNQASFPEEELATAFN